MLINPTSRDPFFKLILNSDTVLFSFHTLSHAVYLFGWPHFYSVFFGPLCVEFPEIKGLVSLNLMAFMGLPI